MEVIKASGKKEAFDRDKFCKSLERSGASQAVIDRVCKTVESHIQQNTTTDTIHKKVAQELVKESVSAVARYSLKRGIMELGPAGFLFEQYIAALLAEYGYETKTNVVMQGACVSHEIDVMAEKDQKHFIIETKYRNKGGLKVDLQVPMYQQARLQDIVASTSKRHSSRFAHRAWVITNTKFTKKAIQYATCMGIVLTGWGYPTKESLQRLIEKKRLYPITVLPSVHTNAREKIAAKNVMFTKELVNFSIRDLRFDFKLPAPTAKKIYQETQQLHSQT
jgi:Holliday junction resolvase-like predicted endonuclease